MAAILKSDIRVGDALAITYLRNGARAEAMFTVAAIRGHRATLLGRYGVKRVTLPMVTTHGARVIRDAGADVRSKWDALARV